MNIHDEKFDMPKAVLKVAISPIPVVGSVISEVLSYLDGKYIERRLAALENEVDNLGISIDTFKERLVALENDEHKYYVVRNNLKYLCLNALPETVEVFNKALIEIIMKDEYGMAEHATEIIRQLNYEDISVLRYIKQFTENNREKD